MGLLKNWQGNRGIMIQLVCWFAWLSNFALAQFDISEGVTGSVNFPALGITCVANLAVFVTSLIRGRLDLELGARDFLDIVASPTLKSIEGFKHGNGLVTTYASGKDLKSVDAIMLSNATNNWSMKQFMKSNAPIVASILLQSLPFQDAVNDAKVKEELNTNDAKVKEELIPEVSIAPCVCEQTNSCKCIAFWTVQEITIMLARRVPGTLKQLSDSLCLLPCRRCLSKGCHGCDQRLLYVEVDNEILTEGDPMVEYPAAVCGILDGIPGGDSICICIPMNDSHSDQWTRLLVRSFRSKDAEGRGMRVMASEALEGYLAGGREGEEGTVEYNKLSFIVPRLTEALINLVLTFWFKVDGVSSALVARRTVRDYLVDTKGSGLAANAYLTRAHVKSDGSNSQVCQVLSFRGNVVSIRSLSVMVGCVNLLSSLGWAVLIAVEDGADTSPPLSMPMLLVIITAIAIVFCMDLAFMLIGNADNFLFNLAWCILVPIPLLILSPLLWALKLHILHWDYPDRRLNLLKLVLSHLVLILFHTVLALEIVCIVSGSAVAGTLGVKGFGRWIYGVVQILVWLKWAAGSYLLNDKSSSNIAVEFTGGSPHASQILVYSSAFLLNAILAGVRCKWEPWPWKDHQLSSRKLGPSAYPPSFIKS